MLAPVFVFSLALTTVGGLHVGPLDPRNPLAARSWNWWTAAGMTTNASYGELKDDDRSARASSIR